MKSHFVHGSRKLEPTEVFEARKPSDAPKETKAACAVQEQAKPLNQKDFSNVL